MSLSRPLRGWEEEGDNDGAGSSPPPAKRPRRCCCCCCQETKDFYEGQIEILKKEMHCMSRGVIEERKTFQREMQGFYQNSQLKLNELITEQSRRMQQCYQNSQLICEQFNALISEIRRPGDHIQHYTSLRTISDQSQIRTHRLKFENRCCHDKYSRHDVTADDGSPIKVAIHDHDNKIITHGPLSSMQVSIVVLDGEFNSDRKEQWSEDYFRSKIVPGRPGKPPLFSKKLYLRLENGVANLCGVKFQDNSSFVPSKKFMLGVMASDDSISEKVQEGISEPFFVKDGRGFPAKKNSSPCLSDPVYKLKKIAPNGDRRKLLEQQGIKMVKHFLWFYNKDKNCLREVCRNIPDHDWNIIVRHALSCIAEDMQYSYYIQEKDVTILFNSLYSIIGAKSSGVFTSYEKLNKTLKAGALPDQLKQVKQEDLVEEYRTAAYDNLEIVRYEDENASNEHELVYGDRDRVYLRGSCSKLPSPTLPTQFCDEFSNKDEVSESGPPRASPHARQSLPTIVAAVILIQRWKKVAELSIMIKSLLRSPGSNFGVVDDPLLEL